MAKQHDSVMTIEELSRYLKVSKSTLYKLAQEGKVPGHKVGRHWRFSRAVVDRWLGNDGQGRSSRRLTKGAQA